MKTELTYLLEELEKYPDSKQITIGELKKIIINSFEKAAVDEQKLSESVFNDMH